MMARKKNSKGSNEAQKKVNFTLLAQKAKKVYLAGDFNNWDVKSHPLKRNSNGTWKAKIELMPGSYEYRFMVDGEWMNDPNCTSTVSNPFGSENSSITVLDVVIT